MPVLGARPQRNSPLIYELLGSGAVIVVVDVLALFAAVSLFGSADIFGWAYCILVAVWLASRGSYRRHIAPNLRHDLAPLLGTMACTALPVALLRTVTADRLLHTIPIATVLLIGGRSVSGGLQRLGRRGFGDGEVALVVGSGSIGCQVVRTLMDHPEYGIHPVGFIDGFPDDGRLPLPILGDIDAFDAVVRRTGATHVIIAFGAHRESELIEVLRASAQPQVEFYVVPRLFELGESHAGPRSGVIWGTPIYHARRAALRTSAWRVKRFVDIALAVFALAMTLPVALLAAAAVKLTSPGPVLFRQRRVGQRGQVIEVVKLRSMWVRNDGDAAWCQLDDPWVTPVGRVLRATGIDELPQLINVVRGHMSLVGPRPERPQFADEFDSHISNYHDRLRVPVGLTGWAQVHNLRGDTSIEERARFDNYYIENWSLWFDIVIMGRTIQLLMKDAAKLFARRR